MNRGSLAVLMVVLAGATFALGGPWSHAQDDDADDTEKNEAAQQADDDADDDVDDVLFSDGVFKPSEKIEADSEISLPSDI